METTESTFGRYESKFCLIECFTVGGMDSRIESQGASALEGLDPQISFPLICMLFAVFIAWVYVLLGNISRFYFFRANPSGNNSISINCICGEIFKKKSLTF